MTMEALPQTPHGKIDRAALPAPDRGPARAPALPPRNPLETALHRIWTEILQTDSVGVDDNFFDLGGHSLLALRLQAQVRKQLQLDFPLSVLFEGGTIAHLAAALERASINTSSPAGAAPAASRWWQRIGGTVARLRATAATPARAVTAIQPAGSRRPLFFVHPINGEVLCYAELARQVGTDQPCYGLRASAAADRAEADISIEQMARDYIRDLRATQPQGPYALAGWSMGGVIAFEMAQQLRRQGSDIGLLLLIDSFPGASARIASEHDLRIVFGEELTQQAAPLDPAGIERLWPIYRANYQALARYTPSAYDGRITLFMASGTPAEPPRMPMQTWAALAAGLTIEVLPGDHASILRHPAVRITADKLNALLRGHAASID